MLQFVVSTQVGQLLVDTFELGLPPLQRLLLQAQPVLELLRVGHELEHPLVLLDVPFLGFAPAAQPPCLIPTVMFFQGSWSFVVLAGSVDYFICNFFVMNS